MIVDWIGRILIIDTLMSMVEWRAEKEGRRATHLDDLVNAAASLLENGLHAFT